MSKKSYPTDVLEQAQSVLSAWEQIEESKSYGAVNVAAITAGITQTTQILPQIDSLDAQLTNLRNQRDDLYADLWDMVKRVRSGVKADYGDDLSEYEMVGGTRTSDRKAPVRKAKTV